MESDSTSTAQGQSSRRGCGMGDSTAPLGNWENQACLSYTNHRRYCKQWKPNGREKGEFICLQGHVLQLCRLCPEQPKNKWGWTLALLATLVPDCGTEPPGRRGTFSNIHKTQHGEEESLTGWEKTIQSNLYLLSTYWTHATLENNRSFFGLSRIHCWPRNISKWCWVYSIYFLNGAMLLIALI